MASAGSPLSEYAHESQALLSSPARGGRRSRGFILLSIVAAASLLIAVAALVLSLVPRHDRRMQGALTIGYPVSGSDQNLFANRVVSLDGNGTLHLGAGLSLFLNATPFDALVDNLTHLAMISLGNDTVLVGSAAMGLLLGRLQSNFDVQWQHSATPLPAAVDEIDGFVSLSASMFVILSGGTVVAGRVTPQNAIQFGPVNNYYTDVTVDPILVSLSSTRFAISYFARIGKSENYDIRGIVGDVNATTLSISMAASSVWSADDHTFHYLVSLNETALVFMCPLDNITAGIYSGPLAVVVALVAADGSLTVGPQLQVPGTPDQLDDFFGAAALSQDTAVVVFPDQLLGDGLRAVAIRVAALDEVETLASFVPNPGDMATMYRFMSVEALDDSRFVIAYTDGSRDGTVTVLLCALIPPGVRLVAEPAIEISRPIVGEGADVQWIAAAALSTDRFAVAYAFTGTTPIPGGRVVVADAKGPALGYAQSGWHDSLAVVTQGTVRVAGTQPNMRYYTNPFGALIGAPSKGLVESDFIVTADGWLVTEAVGFGLENEQLLLDV